MKISFYASLPVGIACDADPVDIVLTAQQDCSAIQQSVQNNLPSGLGISKVETFEHRIKCWLKFQYRIRMNQTITPEKSEELFQHSEIWIFRTHNAKRVNIRPYLLDYHLTTAEGPLSTVFEITTRMDTTGSVSVWEILELLRIPLNDTVILDITRTSVTLMPIENIAMS